MTKWRNRLKNSDFQKLLETTIETGFQTDTIQKRSLDKVNVDTTVQEKNIAYPTDIMLYYRLIGHLVKISKAHGVYLKQTYCRVGKKLLRKSSGYVHARQMKRVAKTRKKMKTCLGRLYRDILRKAPDDLLANDSFKELQALVARAMKQTRKSKNKLYSTHEPHVECISKDVYVDLGYRKHDYDGEATVNIVGRSRKKLTRDQRKWFNRRSVIEADIGHMKNDHRLNRNYLKGKMGDEFNAVMAACGYNLRCIYRRIASIFFVFNKLRQKLLKNMYFFAVLLKKLRFIELSEMQLQII